MSYIFFSRYSTISPTVTNSFIFWSGISISNSSSNATTTLITSKELNPKSVTRLDYSSSGKISAIMIPFSSYTSTSCISSYFRKSASSSSSDTFSPLLRIIKFLHLPVSVRKPSVCPN